MKTTEVEVSISDFNNNVDDIRNMTTYSTDEFKNIKLTIKELLTVIDELRAEHNKTILSSNAAIEQVEKNMDGQKKKYDAAIEKKNE